MNPSYIYFKELAIDSEDTFNLNFSKDNEIENIFLDKDVDLLLYILNPEGTTTKIPLTKKKMKQMYQKKKKNTYFNTTMQKSEDILVYDFYGHFEKFGLEWENVKLGFKYTIEKAGQKIKKNIIFTRGNKKKNCY